MSGMIILVELLESVKSFGIVALENQKKLEALTQEVENLKNRPNYLSLPSDN